MPSKHTVVVSLDAETEEILNNLGENRSKWIRDAIKWRHTSDFEVVQSLAEARSRRIETMLRAIRLVIAHHDNLGTVETHGHRAADAINALRELDY